MYHVRIDYFPLSEIDDDIVWEEDRNKFVEKVINLYAQ